MSFGGYQRRDDDTGNEQKADMYVPAGDCGKIIGRGGSKIRELQDQTNCKIKVDRDDTGDGTRRVELRGDENAIADAREQINMILAGGGDDRGGRQSYGQQRGGGGGGYGGGRGGGGGGGGFGGGFGGGDKEVMQIDTSFVGRIIGKGGSRVRELQEDTGCRINVSRDGGQYGQTDVELVGDRNAINRAKDAIEDICNQAY